MIGRMYSASPSDRERFFMRLLLLQLRGATSFVDLRTVNGVVCAACQEAAKALGLLNDDEE